MAVTPLGQLPFFTEYLQVSGLFDPWVEQCPVQWASPNAPCKRDVLGTAVLSILCAHQRYAHISALRGDSINALLLGMEKVVREDSVRAIHHGRAVVKRGRRHEELVAQSGALALLTNITMAWNTHHMDRVHKAWQQEEANKINLEMLPHITPVRYEHINFRGVFAFLIGPYRERLLGTSVEQSARAA